MRRADKQRAFVSAQAPHFRRTKGNADFYNGHGNWALLPQVPRGEKTACSVLVQTRCYTRDAPQVFVSLVPTFFNWISLKVQINLGGVAVSPVVA